MGVASRSRNQQAKILFIVYGVALTSGGRISWGNQLFVQLKMIFD